jgi:hypothetical protein
MGMRVSALLLFAFLGGCAAGGAAAERPAAPPGPAAAESVPGVQDLVQGRAVFFTRRLGGETVAFRFVPTEVTSRGRVLGELAWEGRRGSGRETAVAAAVGFERGAAGDCAGRITLRLEPVALEGLAAPATLDPVSVDLRRAGSLGRAAVALCQGAGDLVATLRDLGAQLDDLLARD